MPSIEKDITLPIGRKIFPIGAYCGKLFSKAKEVFTVNTVNGIMQGGHFMSQEPLSQQPSGHQGQLPHDHGQKIEHTLERMPGTQEFQAVSDIFRQLGDSSRTRIFWLLCHCEECVINLSAIMGMSSPAVSHHLKLLKASGLIVSRREGKEVYYRAADTQAARLLHHMIEMLVEIACPNL